MKNVIKIDKWMKQPRLNNCQNIKCDLSYQGECTMREIEIGENGECMHKDIFKRIDKQGIK